MTLLFDVVGRTSVMAALAARNLGFGRSALGRGGGRAAICGDAASADKSFAEGGFVDEGAFNGVTDGWVSVKFELFEELDGSGTVFGGCARADIMACL